MQARVMFLEHDTSYDGAFQMCEVLLKYLKRFSSNRADTTKNIERAITQKNASQNYGSCA